MNRSTAGVVLVGFLVGVGLTNAWGAGPTDRQYGECMFLFAGTVETPARLEKGRSETVKIPAGWTPVGGIQAELHHGAVMICR